MQGPILPDLFFPGFETEPAGWLFGSESAYGKLQQYDQQNSVPR